MDIFIFQSKVDQDLLIDHSRDHDHDHKHDNDDGDDDNHHHDADFRSPKVSSSPGQTR